MSVRWEDPPPPGNGKNSTSGLWRDLFRELMKRPGTWACVKADARSSYGTHLRRNAEQTMGGKWEGTTRKNDDGTTRVYLRYLGDE